MIEIQSRNVVQKMIAAYLSVEKKSAKNIFFLLIFFQELQGT